MSDLYVVIANYSSPYGGPAQQSLWPSIENPGLYSEDEALNIVQDNQAYEKEMLNRSTAWHTKPLSMAHKYVKDAAASRISALQQTHLRENKAIKMKKSQLIKIIREALGPLPMDVTRRSGGYIPAPEQDPVAALRDGIVDLGPDAESTFIMLVLDLKVRPEEVAENFPPLASILSKMDQQTLVDVAESL